MGELLEDWYNGNIMTYTGGIMYRSESVYMRGFCIVLCDTIRALELYCHTCALLLVIRFSLKISIFTLSNCQLIVGMIIVLKKEREGGRERGRRESGREGHKSINMYMYVHVTISIDHYDY